jgi:hypothetical protein
VRSRVFRDDDSGCKITFLVDVLDYSLYNRGEYSMYMRFCSWNSHHLLTNGIKLLLLFTSIL